MFSWTATPWPLRGFWTTASERIVCLLGVESSPNNWSHMPSRAIRRIRPMTVLSGGRNGYSKGVGVPHAKYSIAYLRHGGSSLLISAGALTIEPTSHPEAERRRLCESTPPTCDIAKFVILSSRSALQS